MTQDNTGPKQWPLIVDWQPIETAPKDGTKVLTFIGAPGGWDMAVSDWRDYIFNHNGSIGPASGHWHVFGLNYSVEPTHWIPLPEPPKTAKNVNSVPKRNK
jgi:hypothetical protein